MSREAALKAWATRRTKRRQRILTTGRRAMPTVFGGRAKSGPAPTNSRDLIAALKGSLKTASSPLTPRRAQMINALRQVDAIGKRRAGTMADRASWEWARYAERTAREAAHRLRPSSARK